MLRALRAAFACALITLAVTGTARATGGDYVFDGGTAQQQGVVRAALDASAFPWGVTQHEYAHQADFLMLSEDVRTALTSVLGARTQCWNSDAGLAHAQYGCERFASTLAWSYWQSPDNVLAPHGPSDESAAMEPGRFKALLGAVLRARSADAQLVTIKAFVGRAPEVTKAARKPAAAIPRRPAQRA